MTVLDSGDESNYPKRGSLVAFHYNGCLSDGTVFGSSMDARGVTKGDPVKCRLGSGNLIRGLEIALPFMSKGQKALIRLAPEHVYGDEGCPPSVPGGTEIEIWVHLLTIRL